VEGRLSADALRFSRHDSTAFATFYRNHAEPLLIYTTRRVYDVDTAFDLVSETFAKAFLKRRSFRGHTDGEAGAWLYTIASREIAQYFRRSAVHKRAMTRLGMQTPLVTEDDEARILELAELDPFRMVVRQELEKLSAGQREALQLRVVDDLEYEEVASRLEISEEAARARVARGLRALATALNQHETQFEGGMA
jgi:RNA polymerase sigma-70 factor (ECF subfamily)